MIASGLPVARACSLSTARSRSSAFWSTSARDTAWGDAAAWENQAEANAPHEANFLKLDCSKLKTTFGWTPRWHMAECMEKTVAFSKIWLANGDVPAEMEKEINSFLEEQK